MFYIDANVFLDAILYDDDKALKAKELLVKAAEKEESACTSVMTWDEIVWISRRFLGPEKSRAEGKKFIEFPNLEIISVDAIIIQEAQRLMDTCGLKPRDAIHAASAISKGIRKIASNDPDFEKVKELKRINIKNL